MKRTETQELKSGLVMSMRHGRPDFAKECFQNLISANEILWLSRYLPLIACSSHPSMLYDLFYRYSYSYDYKLIEDWIMLCCVSRINCEAFALHQLALWGKGKLPLTIDYGIIPNIYDDVFKAAKMYCGNTNLFGLLDKTSNAIGDSEELNGRKKYLTTSLLSLFTRGSAKNLELVGCAIALIIRTDFASIPSEFVWYDCSDSIPFDTFVRRSYSEFDWYSIKKACIEVLGSEIPELAIDRLSSLFLHRMAFPPTGGVFWAGWWNELFSYFNMSMDKLDEFIHSINEILIS